MTALGILALLHQIVMSYGERDNNDFLVHYGFVPEANPHDSVQLFSDGPEEAAEWFLQHAYSSVDFTASDVPDVQVRARPSHPVLPSLRTHHLELHNAWQVAGRAFPPMQLY